MSAANYQAKIQMSPEPKKIQDFLQLCNAMCIILYKQQAFLQQAKLSPPACVVFPFRATSHFSDLLLKGYFKIILGTFPYMVAATRSNRSALFGSCSLAL